MGTFPGSLSEGAVSPQGLTEGVSSDGCSMPTIYKPAHINSEIFERLRSSKYTPSASASLRQLPQRGSRGGAVPFIRVLAKIRGWRAIFIAPTEALIVYILPFGGGSAPTKKAAGYSAAFWEVITLQRLLRAGWGQGWRWHACKSSAAAPPSPEPPRSCQTR